MERPFGARIGRVFVVLSGPARQFVNEDIDPCVGQGTALHLVTGDAQVLRYGVELDAERARIASTNGIETIQGNALDAIARPESFSLLYLNPPYDSEIGSIANRRMEAVFLEHTYRWLAMEGVLILVIPFERLHDCSGKHVTTFVEQDGDTEIIHHRERWANELYLVYADGRTLKLTETPAKKEDEADGECTPAVRAA